MIKSRLEEVYLLDTVFDQMTKRIFTFQKKRYETPHILENFIHKCVLHMIKRNENKIIRTIHKFRRVFRD